MNKQHSNRNILFIICFPIILGFTAMAFQNSAKHNHPVQKYFLDTVPKKSDINIDINMQEMERSIQKSMEEVDKSLKQIEWNKISKEIELSMKKIDIDKLKIEINNSIKSIDMDKIKREIDISLNEIDKNKLKLDIERDVNNSLKSINTEEIKKSLEEVKNINFDGLKKQMNNLKKEMELNKDHFKIGMDKAKQEMLKAKGGLIKIKEMTAEMEKDGLINKKEKNSIEFKNNELLINGKLQSQDVTKKYRKYFKGDNFTFKFNGEN